MTAPFELLDYEKQAVRDFVDALPGMNLPWRQASFNNPTFWSKPLVLTAALPINPGSTWTDVFDLRGRTSSTGLVNSYTATSFGDASIDDLEYRFVFNGALPPFVSFVSGVEYSKSAPATFPVIPRQTFFTVRPIDRLQLQVRNNSAAPRYLIAALYGWFFDDNNAYEINYREGITDVR